MNALAISEQRTILDFLEGNSCPLLMLGRYVEDVIIDGLPIKKYKNANVIELREWLQWGSKRFHWKFGRIPSVGLNEPFLLLSRLWKKVIVIVDAKTKEVYVIEPETILQYCKDWKMQTKGKDLIVCPKSYLYRYKGETLEEVRKKCHHLKQNLSLAR